MGCQRCNIDDLVKSLKRRISVIPAKAGIQLFQTLKIFWTPVSTGVTTFYDSINIREMLWGMAINQKGKEGWR
jgi:hypothetical protein